MGQGVVKDWLHAWPPYLKAMRKYRREYGTRALMAALKEDWRHP